MSMMYMVAEGNLPMVQMLHEKHKVSLTLGYMWGITLLDFAPSLLDACAIPVPDAMQGRSVLPLMTPRRHGDALLDWPTESFVQISEAQIGRCVVKTKTL